MSTLEVQIPDLLLKEVNEIAAKDKVSVDQIVSIALAAQVSASQARESILSRAKRVNWQKVDEILARVPNNPPLPGDEMD
jgi:metal-responsive CopG/Arc/MetJ family transcriptional regulator